MKAMLPLAKSRPAVKFPRADFPLSGKPDNSLRLIEGVPTVRANRVNFIRDGLTRTFGLNNLNSDSLRNFLTISPVILTIDLVVPIKPRLKRVLPALTNKLGRVINIGQSTRCWKRVNCHIEQIPFYPQSGNYCGVGTPRAQPLRDLLSDTFGKLQSASYPSQVDNALWRQLNYGYLIQGGQQWLKIFNEVTLYVLSHEQFFVLRREKAICQQPNRTTGLLAKHTQQLEQTLLTLSFLEFMMTDRKISGRQYCHDRTNRLHPIGRLVFNAEPLQDNEQRPDNGAQAKPYPYRGQPECGHPGFPVLLHSLHVLAIQMPRSMPAPCHPVQQVAA